MLRSGGSEQLGTVDFDLPFGRRAKPSVATRHSSSKLGSTLAAPSLLRAGVV